MKYTGHMYFLASRDCDRVLHIQRYLIIIYIFLFVFGYLKTRTSSLSHLQWIWVFNSSTCTGLKLSRVPILTPLHVMVLIIIYVYGENVTASYSHPSSLCHIPTWWECDWWEFAVRPSSSSSSPTTPSP